MGCLLTNRAQTQDARTLRLVVRTMIRGVGVIDAVRITTLIAREAAVAAVSAELARIFAVLQLASLVIVMIAVCVISVVIGGVMVIVFALRIRSSSVHRTGAT